MRKSQIPELTHLQSLVITCLGKDPARGKTLREDLARCGVKKSGPAFYQLMSRMESAGLVEGEYTQKIVDGQIIKERIYNTTALGRRSVQQTTEFYALLQTAYQK